MRQEPATDVEPAALPTAPIPDPSPDGGTRRRLLAGAGLAGLAGVLAACGGSSDSGGGDSGSGGGGGGGASNSSGGLAKTADIPVGGGKVFEGEKVVITQPAEGQFECFSAVCTHKGCTVDDVSDGTINCPCHGSKFSVKDASVAGGPASEPLEKKQIKVQGGQIVLG
jgi:nitrite reductase/ring-hydroxylating ferredoxin subunit